MAMQKIQKWYSDKDLGLRYGTHRTSIWRWVREGQFPEPVKLSPGCTRWPDHVIQDWEIRILRKEA